MNLTTTTQADAEIVRRVVLAMMKQLNVTKLDELTQKTGYWWNGLSVNDC